MEMTRFSELWRKVFSSLQKMADGYKSKVHRPFDDPSLSGGKLPSSKEMSQDPAELLEQEYSESTESVDAPEKVEYIPPKSFSGTLLDPQEKERAAEGMKPFPEEFLHMKHEPVNIPEHVGGESASTTEGERKRLDDMMQAAIAKRDELEKDEFYSDADMNAIIKEMEHIKKLQDKLEKKYDPDTMRSKDVGAERKSIEKDIKDKEKRLKELQSQADPNKEAIEGLVNEIADAKELLQGFDVSYSPEQEAERKDALGSLRKMIDEFADEGGLAGRLLSKPGNILDKKDAGELGLLVRSIREILSKNELKGTLDQERYTVRELLTTLIKLGDKYGESVRQYLDGVASAIKENTHSEGSAVQSSLSGWHGNDPIKIAIAARLRVSAGRKHSLRDTHVGKQPIYDRRSTVSMQDITSEVGTLSPTNAFEEMVKSGPARSIFEKGLKDAFDIYFEATPGSDGDIDSVFESSAAQAYEALKPQYDELHREFSQPVPSKQELPDPGPSFIREYVELSDKVFDRILAVSEQPGGSTKDTETGEVMYLPEREHEGPKEWDEEKGEWVPRKREPEQVEVSPEEMAEKAKGEEDIYAKETAALTRDVLYYQDGTPRDAKQLYVELPENKHAELRGLIEEEIKRLESMPEEKINLGFMQDNLKQLDHMMSSSETRSEERAEGAMPADLKTMPIEELLGLASTLPKDIVSGKNVDWGSTPEEAHAEARRIDAYLTELASELAKKAKTASNIESIDKTYSDMEKEYNTLAPRVEELTDKLDKAKDGKERGDILQQLLPSASALAGYRALMDSLSASRQKVVHPGLKEGTV